MLQQQQRKSSPLSAFNRAEKSCQNISLSLILRRTQSPEWRFKISAMRPINRLSALQSQLFIL
jgi:hypothetical protein